MIKIWEITAELNMDASRYEKVTVATNTRKKAIKLAEEKLKSEGAFYVFITEIKEV